MNPESYRIVLNYASCHRTLLLFFCTVLCYLTWVRYHNRLNTIPGPFLASISSLWKFYVVWIEDMPRRNALLHQKFGPLVRIGPNHVSASSEDAVQVIHRAKTGFNKVILTSTSPIQPLTDD